jgi:hypothetical protein
MPKIHPEYKHRIFIEYYKGTSAGKCIISRALDAVNGSGQK